jgi:hypothetical protein
MKLSSRFLLKFYEYLSPAENADSASSVELNGCYRMFSDSEDVLTPEDVSSP